MKPIFDVIFSFDPEDSRYYGLTYIKQFLPFTWQQIQSINDENHQIERANLINEITHILTECNCTTDFYLMDKYNDNVNHPLNCINKKIDYNENINKLSKSRFVLEINKPDQKGLTLRAIEALVFNKQLITNNPEIKNQEFYHSSRNFFYSGNNPQELKQFLHTQPINVQPEVARKYSADGMLETLKQHMI